MKDITRRVAEAAYLMTDMYDADVDMPPNHVWGFLVDAAGRSNLSSQQVALQVAGDVLQHAREMDPYWKSVCRVNEDAIRRDEYSKIRNKEVVKSRVVVQDFLTEDLDMLFIAQALAESALASPAVRKAMETSGSDDLELQITEVLQDADRKIVGVQMLLDGLDTWRVHVDIVDLDSHMKDMDNELLGTASASQIMQDKDTGSLKDNSSLKETGSSPQASPQMSPHMGVQASPDEDEEKDHVLEANAKKKKKKKKKKAKDSEEVDGSTSAVGMDASEEQRSHQHSGAGTGKAASVVKSSDSAAAKKTAVSNCYF